MKTVARCCVATALLGCLVSCGDSGSETSGVERGTPHEPRATLSLKGADPEVTRLIQQLLGEARDAPQSATVRGNLALALDANGFRDVAISTYGQAAALNPRAFKWPYLQALLLGKRGDYEAAITSMSAALGISRAYAPALLWQGEWLLEANRVDEALAVYEEAERLGTEGPAAAAGIARVLLRTGQHEAALGILEPACRRWSYYQLHRLLGRAYRAVGKTEEAQIAFHRGNKLGELRWSDPIQGEREQYLVSFGDRLARAERLQRSGQSDKAFELLAELRSEQPDNPRLRRAIAISNLHAGRTDTALDTLRRAIEKHPENYELHTLAAAAYRLSGRTARALEHVEQAISLVEERGEGHFLAATLHYQRLEREKALAALERALRCGLADAHSALELAARIESELGRWSAAVGHLERAVQVDISDAGTHLELARGLAEVGRFDDAGKSLGFAAKLGTHGREHDEAERYIAALQGGASRGP